ncbi:transcription factor Sp3-like isoform X1 [Sergentomyia squamirostris]
MEMDDNDNFLDYQKMNFSPFTTQFASAIPANAVNQFTAAKFTQNITTANGQVVGLVSGGDGGVHYLRPVESGAAFPGQTQTTTTSNSLQQSHQTLITLPITMPGAKPGDAQQTVQIQVVNPNPIQQQPKFQMGQMQIPIQGLQQGTTVLTVAYAPQEGDILQNHGLPEGMTVVAALQPQDLQMLAQAQAQAMSNQAQQQQQQQQNTQQSAASQTSDSKEEEQQQQQQLIKPIQIKQEPVWQQNPVSTSTASSDISEYLSRITSTQELPLHLHHFLKFNAETIKRESQVENSPLNGALITYDYGAAQQQQVESQSESGSQDASVGTDIQGDIPALEGGEKTKKKRRYKKKPPKPKRPKPGQVHIATALDGTILFCCPECHRAYPEKENLEQHLSVHKIERRFICDICGAGLKRKEHLERHKLGHNPDRPYICSVCMKGFKRKEHLNLHFVIHSGEKTEICGECGKGFYRKDHLRKHAKSHAMKRMKEELSAQASAAAAAAAAVANVAVSSGAITTSVPGLPAVSITAIPAVSVTNSQPQEGSSAADNDMTTNVESASIQTSIAVPVTTATNTTIIHVPTSNNTTLPVQIQLPQLVATTTSADTVSTNVVMPPTSVGSLM